MPNILFQFVNICTMHCIRSLDMMSGCRLTVKNIKTLFPITWPTKEMTPVIIVLLYCANLLETPTCGANNVESIGEEAIDLGKPPMVSNKGSSSVLFLLT